jgi:hypothetical protein
MTVTDDRMFFGTLVYSDGRENLREGDHDIGWCLYPYGQIWWLVTCPGMTRRLHGVGMFHTHCRGSKDTLCSLRAPKGVIRIPPAETVITRVSCREKLFTNKRKVGKFYFRWIGGLKEYSDGGGFAKGA